MGQFSPKRFDWVDALIEQCAFYREIDEGSYRKKLSETLDVYVDHLKKIRPLDEHRDIYLARRKGLRQFVSRHKQEMGLGIIKTPSVYNEIYPKRMKIYWAISRPAGKVKRSLRRGECPRQVRRKNEIPIRSKPTGLREWQVFLFLFVYKWGDGEPDQGGSKYPPEGVTMSFSTIRHPPTGVTYLRSDILMSRHAFSTRLGGVSQEPHTASLNLAFGRGDADGVVLQNLSRFGEAVGFDPASVVSIPQIHGRDVFLVDSRHRGMGYLVPPVLPGGATGGDGYVTACPDVTLGVKTADCTPILLEARWVTASRREVVAVAALHAGWKGTVADIAGEGVARLREVARSVIGSWSNDRTAPGHLDIYAAIGPCIHPCCFEVREDCLTVVRRELGDLAAPYICATTQGNGVRYALDLPGLNRALLLRAGVGEGHIDVCSACTACHVDTFYSHRAQAGRRGTLLHVILPVEA